MIRTRGGSQPRGTCATAVSNGDHRQNNQGVRSRNNPPRRAEHSGWAELPGFQKIRDIKGRIIAALCIFCKQELKDKSHGRLKRHR